MILSMVIEKDKTFMQRLERLAEIHGLKERGEELLGMGFMELAMKLVAARERMGRA